MKRSPYSSNAIIFYSRNNKEENSNNFKKQIINKWPGNNFVIIICFFLSIISISSCGTSKQTQVITPTAKRSLPALPESRILIPVKVYMKPLLAYMDSSTAKEFTSEKWPDFYQSSCDFRYKYRFIRSPFTFSCVNNVVNIGFRGYYQ
ncbi:MAG: hypothetical protein ACXWCT_14835, partial [Flavitalea sp.]